MGVCYVIQPLGSGKFQILGLINPKDW
jgi:hypothetical protein